jgi:hypothetical protein
MSDNYSNITPFVNDAKLNMHLDRPGVERLIINLNLLRIAYACREWIVSKQPISHNTKRKHVRARKSLSSILISGCIASKTFSLALLESRQAHSRCSFDKDMFSVQCSVGFAWLHFNCLIRFVYFEIEKQFMRRWIEVGQSLVPQGTAAVGPGIFHPRVTCFDHPHRIWALPLQSMTSLIP